MPADDSTFSDLMKSGAVPLAATPKHTSSATRHGISALLPPADGIAGDTELATAAEQGIYLSNGVADNVIKKLRRDGPADTCDLHGLTIVEAHEKLQHFLNTALARGDHHIEIVHGRGQHSSDGKGVLRGNVRYWLQRCDAVLAYCEPPKNSGAVLVLLRHIKYSRRK